MKPIKGCPVENKVNGKPNREYPRAHWVKIAVVP